MESIQQQDCLVNSKSSTLKEFAGTWKDHSKIFFGGVLVTITDKGCWSTNTGVNDGKIWLHSDTQ